MRYRVHVLGWTLIWSGVFIFGYVGWQLWVTDWINAGVQAEASEGLESSLAAGDPTGEQFDTDDLFEGRDRPSGLPETVEFYREDPPDVGESFAFLTIPSIGLEEVVVYEGVDTQTLRSGPGHMPSTPLPGQPGNSVVSGHRTTHGRPFFDFDLLETGHRIEVETSVGTHVYEVREIEVVQPTDVWVTDSRPGGWLTLTTCEPKFSARQRLIVFAEMVAGPNLDYIRLDQTASGL